MENNSGKEKGSKAKEVVKHAAEHVAEHTCWHVAAHLAGFSNAAGMMAAGLFSVSNGMPEEEFPAEKLKAAQKEMERKYGVNPDGTLKCPWRPSPLRK